jgi:pimeloyl-ACP methyl ester carboxylesterase
VKRRRLDPSEMYPAGHADIETRMVHTRDGIRLRVALAGDPAAVPVVMLHGWAGSLYAHRCALERLPARGVRVIAPDLRGHGLSEKPIARGAYRLPNFLEDLRVILDAFMIERAVLFGQSMGGAIALHATLEMPERVSGLVLVGPAALSAVPITRLARLIPPLLIRKLGPTFVRRWMVRGVLRRLVYHDPGRLSETDVDEYWAPSAQGGYAHAARATLSEFDWTPVRQERLATIDRPALVIMGSGDRLVPGAARAATAIPGVRMVSLVAGHGVNEELGEEVCDLVAEFVETEVAPRSANAARGP